MKQIALLMGDFKTSFFDSRKKMLILGSKKDNEII
jgi:hypothetical protein